MNISQAIEAVEKNGYEAQTADDWVHGRNMTCSQRFMYHTRRVYKDGFIMFSPDNGIRGKSVVIFVREAFSTGLSPE